MWRQFALVLLITVLFVYLPGFLAALSLKSKPVTSLVVAPAISGALFSISGIAIYPLGLKGIIPLLAGVCVLCALIFGVAEFCRRRFKWKSEIPEQLDWKFFLITAGITSVLFAVIFHKAIRNPAWFLQSADNYAHLDYIARSMNSGVYSMFHASFYSGSLPAQQLPFVDESFYPYAFHIFAVVVARVMDVRVTVAENAVWFVFVAIVYPVGIAALFQGIFRKQKLIGSIAVAAAVFANIAFPIRAVTVHGIYPNVIAFCCVPACVYLFVASTGGFDEKARKATVGKGTHFKALNEAEHKGGEKIFSACGLVLLVIALLGMLCMQPNADFFWAVLVFPYILVSLIPRIVRSFGFDRSVERKVLSASIPGFFLIAVLAWIAVLNAPFMRPTVNFLWDLSSSPDKVLSNILNFGLLMGMPVFFYSVFFWIGFAHCCCKRSYRWLTLSFIFVAIQFVASLSENIAVKRFLTGFWYTDPERTAAMVVITAAPIVALGVYDASAGLVSLIASGIRRLASGKNVGEKDTAPGVDASEHIRPSRGAMVVKAGISSILAVVWLCCLMSPWDLFKLPAHEKSEIRWGIQYMHEAYAPEGWMPYSVYEQDFVTKAKEITGDEVVLNNPFDGSMMAYAVNGMNVYYRNKIEERETPESRLIRTRITKVASDPEVQKAIKKVGAHYVLVLDYENPIQLGHEQYDLPDFKISDDTPGFETVLSGGPYRLYRITAID